MPSAEPAPRHPLSAWRWLALLVAPLCLVGPALFPGRVFLPQLPAGFAPLSTEEPARAAAAWDGANYCTYDRLFPALSDQIEARRQILSGELALWEPKLGLGVPLLASTVAGFLYPPNWLIVLLPPERAAAPLAILSLFLAGLGMALFLARRGFSPAATFVGALAMQLGGFGVANLFDFMKVDAALWLPWQLWAIEGLGQRARRAGTALAAATAFSLLAGFPPIAVFGLAASAAYAMARFWSARPVLVWALAFLAIGALGAGVQLVPSAEASAHSLRVPKSAADLEAQALPPGSALGLLVPNAIGPPDELPPPWGWPIAWWLSGSDVEAARQANALEWNLCAGVIATLLALCAVLLAPRRAAFPALLWLVALGFAQGWPALRLLYAIPGFDLGAPNRVLALHWTLVPWLAAIAVDELLHVERGSRARKLVGGLGIAAAAGLFALAAWSGRAGFGGALAELLAERHDRPLEVALEVVPEDAAARAGLHLAGQASRAGIAALALACVACATRRSWRAPALVLALALDAFLVLPAHVATRGLDGPLFPESTAIRAVADAAGCGRVLRLDASPGGLEHVQELARPNLLQAYGVSDLTPWIAFTPLSLAEMALAIDPRMVLRSGVARLPALELVAHPLLDQLRVTCILSREPLAHALLEPVWEQPGFCVYRRACPTPPVELLGRAQALAADDQAPPVLASCHVDLSRTVLIGGDALAIPASSGEVLPFVRGELAWSRPAAGRMDVELSGTSGGWLVFHEQWAPGWHATVNGEPAELLRANHALRALRVPAGDVHVRTWYLPDSYRIGLGLSIAAWVLALLLGSLARRPLTSNAAGA